MKFVINGKFVAQIWQSGRIVVYDASRGTVHTEYLPESHLQCVASCAKWKGDNLLILGSRDGSLIMYDALECKVKSFLKKAHSSIVNDILVLDDKLYSCSQDGGIHEYHLQDQSRHYWTNIGDNKALFSLCDYKNGSRLLAASASTLKVFSVEDRSLLKTIVTQHVSPIRYLIPAEGKKILSCADRHVVCWSKKLHPEHTYVFANNITALRQTHDKIYSCTVNGELVFLHKESGKRITAQFASNDAEHLPVHDALVLDDESLIVVYGPTNRPKIETLKIPKKNEVLIRDVPKFKPEVAAAKEVPITQYKPDQAKIIGPMNEKAERKKKSLTPADGLVEREEIPLEDRLVDVESDSGKGEELDDQQVQAPRTDNMVHLLLQGLQSGDQNMLNGVIFQNDPQIIYNTVARLPIDAIQLLVNELTSRLHARPAYIFSTLKWAKQLLIQHSSYLESCPHILESLLYILKNRVMCMDRLTCVKSRLDTILSKSRLSCNTMEAEMTITEEDDTNDDEDEDDEEGESESSSGAESGEEEALDDEDDEDPMEIDV